MEEDRTSEFDPDFRHWTCFTADVPGWVVAMCIVYTLLLRGSWVGLQHLQCLEEASIVLCGKVCSIFSMACYRWPIAHLARCLAIT